MPNHDDSLIYIFDENYSKNIRFGDTLNKRIYTLWGLSCFLWPVINIITNILYPEFPLSMGSRCKILLNEFSIQRSEIAFAFAFVVTFYSSLIHI